MARSYSSLESVVPEIAALRFIKLPKGKHAVDVVVARNRAGFRNLTLMRFPNGDLHCWQVSPSDGKAGGHYLPSEYHLPTLELCVEIGAITQEQLDAHKAAYVQSWGALQARHDLNRLVEMMDYHKVKSMSALYKVLQNKAVKDQRVSRGYRNENVPR